MADFAVARNSDTSSAQKLGTAELLFRCAQQMGLKPDWITRDGLFAVSLEGGEGYINFARSPLNSDTSVSLAKDKYLTRLILERHGIPNIPFARPQNHTEATVFLEQHHKIIAKPVMGAGAQDIHIITEASSMAQLAIEHYILEKYVAGKELRYLVLNDKIIGVHRSDYGISVEATRPLKRISYPKPTWDEALVASSINIAAVLGLRFAAVDYIIDANGDPHVLEVNTTPGLKWFHAPSSGPVVDVARYFLEAMQDRQKTRPSKSRLSTQYTATIV